MANPFTPEQISQILEEFFKVVGTRQYIGARYVPIFGRKGEESIEWDNSAPYEPLTIVLYQGNSYTSRQYVPVGVEITNQEFWALTGNYNAQVELYRQEVKAEKTRAETAEQTLQANIDTEKTRAETAEQTLQANIDAEKTRAEGAEQANATKITENKNDIAANKNDIAEVQSEMGNKLHFYDDEVSFKATSATTGMVIGNYDGSGVVRLYVIGPADDGFGVELDSGLYANPILGSRLNALALGFKTDGSDNSALFNKLFNGKVGQFSTVYFPAGVYTFNSPITVTGRYAFVGDTYDVTDVDYHKGTVFDFPALSENTSAVTQTNAGKISFTGIYFNGHAFVMTDNRSSIGKGVDVFNVSTQISGVNGVVLADENFGCTFERCVFKGFSGNALESKTFANILNCAFFSCSRAIKAMSDNTINNVRCFYVEYGITTSGSLCRITNVRMDSVRYNAIVLNSGRGHIIDNVIADYCQYAVVSMTNNTSTRISNVGGRYGTIYPLDSASENVSSLSTWSVPDAYIDKVCCVALNGYANTNVSIECMRTALNPLDSDSTLLCGLIALTVMKNSNRVDLVTNHIGEYVSATVYKGDLLAYLRTPDGVTLSGSFACGRRHFLIYNNTVSNVSAYTQASVEA